MAEHPKSGNLQETRKHGALMSKTTTEMKTTDAADIESVLNDTLYGMGKYANASARIVEVFNEGSCDGKGAKKYVVELTKDEEAWPLNYIRWSFSCTSSIERTTVDVDGTPLKVSYGKTSDWVDDLEDIQDDDNTTVYSTIIFRYNKYSEQLGEADVYVPTQEITGIRYRLIPENQLITALTSFASWQNTINSEPFFGHSRGNVLCLGIDVEQIGIRPATNEHLIEMRYRFMTRPGKYRNSGGGWDSYTVWTDPVTGLIPADAEENDGAVLHSRHYNWKDFTILYNISEL